MTFKHRGLTFVDTYHVDGFQELGVCDSGAGSGSAIVGEWSEVLKYEEWVTCPQCQTLIALVKANRLEIDFDQSYSASPFDVPRRVLRETYAQLKAPPPLKLRLEELLK